MAGAYYGREGSGGVVTLNEDYPGIHTPLDLYEALQHVWCVETCTPRMRDRWSETDPTVGQCAITSFLAQDIFGGKVYGIPLRDGSGYHCFSVVQGTAFDLTSEQFGSETLRYEDMPEQSRDVHFSREEKRLRYELLKERLHAFLNGRKDN